MADFDERARLIRDNKVSAITMVQLIAEMDEEHEGHNLGFDALLRVMMAKLINDGAYDATNKAWTVVNQVQPIPSDLISRVTATIVQNGRTGGDSTPGVLTQSLSTTGRLLYTEGVEGTGSQQAIQLAVDVPTTEAWMVHGGGIHLGNTTSARTVSVDLLPASQNTALIISRIISQSLDNSDGSFHNVAGGDADSAPLLAPPGSRFFIVVPTGIDDGVEFDFYMSGMVYRI